jgi:Undecaprenyl-phosphate galactose phosphotransferase WbaP
MVGVLLLCDLLVLALVLAATVVLRLWLGGVYELGLYWRLWPFLLLFPASFALMGLYTGAGRGIPDELRRVTSATTLVYLLLGAGSFLFKESEFYSRSVFLVAWLLSLLTVPLARGVVRHLLARQAWWGYPVLILGAGQTGQSVAQTLRRLPGIGLKPVAFLDDDLSRHGELLGLPVLGKLELAPQLAQEWGIRHAILAIPKASRARLLEVLERYGSAFPHLTLIPDLFGVASLWVSAQDFGGTLGLEVRHNLLYPGARWLKRLLDLAIVVLGGVLLLPLLLLLALWIGLDSPGPVFFAHQRLGKDGRPFWAWKFRTMVQSAEQVLAQALQNPQLQAEWQRDHKLKNDPRITRVGRWLRKTSLDELPQLWNVLKGEMSLVGPRPIVQAEVERYGDRYALYSKVLPGITGMWQVSGRNDTSYAERVSLDTYYVRNWSPWLDFYLLARTVWAVLLSRGAY